MGKKKIFTVGYAVQSMADAVEAHISTNITESRLAALVEHQKEVALAICLQFEMPPNVFSCISSDAILNEDATIAFVDFRNLAVSLEFQSHTPSQ